MTTRKTLDEKNPSPPLKSVRQPKQSRSIEKKESILNAALTMFGEKGYYNTTTNEIAEAAGVSIGTLYAYFENKETILLEILDRFHQRFAVATSEALADAELYRTDRKEWFRIIIEALIKVHEESIELIRELNALYYINPKVAAILDEQRNHTRQITLQYIMQHSEDMNVKDPEAAAVVTFDIMSAVVDRVALGRNNISRERIINAGIEAVYKFLVG